MPGEKIRQTVTVSDRGDISLSMPVGSFREGLADLLDFAAPPATIAVLPPGAPTVLGMLKTGQALCEAMAAFRKPQP
jgi:hypothetical protein